MTENKLPKAASNAQKAHKQSLKSKSRNVALKRRIKAVTKEIFTHVSKGEKSEAMEKFNSRAQSLLHKGVTKGVLHKNTAARRISRLARNINSISA